METFAHEIRDIEFVVEEGKVGMVAPLAQILLVARSSSQRMGSLDLSLRFRTGNDVHFQEVTLSKPIKREDYPEGYDPKDPSKSIARELKLRIWTAGNLNRPKNACFMLICGKYTAEGVAMGSLAPFVKIEKKNYTREDVDDEDICVPPI